MPPGKLTLAWDADGRRAAVWEAELSPGWTAAVMFDDQGGRPVVKSINVYAPGDTPRGGLTRTFLRAVPLGQLRADAAAALTKQTPPAKDAGAFLRKSSSSGRPRTLSDEFLVDVVYRYEAAYASNPRSPRVTVATQLGKTPAQVRDWLHEARRRDLMTVEGAGKAGGHPTNTARRIRANTNCAKPDDQ